MNPAYLSVTTGMEVFSVFVIGQAISLAILYAAWRKKLRNLPMGITCISAALVSALLFGSAIWIGPDFTSRLYLLRTACIVLSGLSFGVFAGCMYAIVFLPILTRMWQWHKATRM